MDEREALARIIQGGSDEMWAKFRDHPETAHAWRTADAILAAGFRRPVTAGLTALRDRFCDCEGYGLPDDQHAPLDEDGRGGCHGLEVAHAAALATAVQESVVPPWARVPGPYLLSGGDSLEEPWQHEANTDHEVYLNGLRGIYQCHVCEWMYPGAPMASAPEYQPCSAECNGCPTCDPGLAVPTPGQESGRFSIPKPHVPYGPKHLTPDEATASYFREAARRIGNPPLFGSNLTAAVVKTLTDCADALAEVAPGGETDG